MGIFCFHPEFLVPLSFASRRPYNIGLLSFKLFAHSIHFLSWLYCDTGYLGIGKQNHFPFCIFSHVGDTERSCSKISGKTLRMKSTSSSVLSSLNDKRNEPYAVSWLSLIASRTCYGSSKSDVHAEPDEAQIPFLSSNRIRDSPCKKCNLKWPVLVFLGL